MRYLGSRRQLLNPYNTTANTGAVFTLDFINQRYTTPQGSYTSIGAIPFTTFTNGTGGYADTATGVVHFSPNVARVGAEGYLSELAGTNLLAGNTNIMIGSGWTSQASVGARAVVAAPTGTDSSTLLTTTASPISMGQVYSAGVNVTSGLPYSVSGYFKNGNTGFACLVVSANAMGSGLNVILNLSTGVVTQTTTAGTMFGSVTTKVSSVGNGWYRLSASWIAGATNAVSAVLGMSRTATATISSNGNIPGFQGDTIYIWGAQLEQMASATSYIPNCLAVTNLLQQSDYINTTPWSGAPAGSTTRFDTSNIAPDGTHTASTCITTTTANAVRQSVAVTANTTYTFSFYVKLGTAPSGKYSVYNDTGAADIVSVTSYPTRVNSISWTRVAVTFTTPVGCTSVSVYPVRDTGVTGSYHIWGCQLETGYVANAYVRTSPAVTNIATFSQSLASPNWSVSNGSATNTTSLAPDGTSTATLWTASANTTSVFYKTNGATSFANTQYTISVYAKAGSAQFCFLNYNTAATVYVTAIFDLVNGRLTKLETGPGGNISSAVGAITPDRNGYFRCSISFVIAASGTPTAMAVGVCNVPNPTINGSFGNVVCTSGQTMHFWGAQLELGRGPKAYVPTTTAAASAVAQTSATRVATSTAYRAPDTLVLGPGIGISPTTVRAMLSEQQYFNQLNTNQVVGYLNDGTSSNAVLQGSYLQNYLAQVLIGGSTIKSSYQANPATVFSATRRQGLSFGDNLFVMSQDGKSSTDPAAVPQRYAGTISFDRLQVGGTLGVSTNQMSGYVRYLQLFGKSIDQKNLNVLTRVASPAPAPDKIVASLSTSLSLYNAAAAGVSVPITAAEYALLQTNLTGSSLVGCTTSQMNTTANQISFASGGATVRQAVNTFAVGYPVAYSVTMGSAAGTSTGTGYALGYGTTATGAGVVIGSGSTTATTLDSNQRAYFVVKSPSVLVSAGTMPTVYFTTLLIAAITAAANTTYYAASGGITTTTSSGFPYLVCLQTIQSPTKQWG